MRRYLDLSIHALIASAFVALALTGRVDPFALTLFGAGLAWSFYRVAKDLPPLLSPRGAFVASCVYIVVFLFDNVVVSRSFIPATIHLVLFLEMVKLFQEKNDRDYFYLIVLSFMMILAASSLTIDMTFVLTLVIFFVALVSTLMSFDMFRTSRLRTVDPRVVSGPLSGMSVWATFWIMIVGVVLFFLIPRIGTGYFSRAASTSLLMSGFSENVQLGEIGHVKLSTAVVMRARLIGGKSNVVKWRGIALDAFDGNTWYKTDRRHYGANNAMAPHYALKPVRPNSPDVVRYQVLLEPLATTSLFGPHQVRTIDGRVSGGLEFDNDDGVYTRFPSIRRFQYEVTSEIPRPPGAGSPNESVALNKRKYLQLPPDTDPRIHQLAATITAGATTFNQKAAAVETYLKQNYKYTLELTWDPGDQPITTFLFTAKAGHCEYFASSMAVLLRTAGVPTRLVNGFLMGEYNPIGGDFIIRQSDAHSWVEVLIGEEWIEFDPTPPDPNQRGSGLLTQISHYLDAMELYWNSYILVYDSSVQLQLFRSAQEQVQRAQANARTSTEVWITRSQVLGDLVASRIQLLMDRPSFWVTVLLIIAGVVAFRNRRYLHVEMEIWRLRRGRGQVTTAVVEQMFYRAVRLAKPSTQERKPEETWREWALKLPDTERSRLKRALEIFERSKYGRLPISSADFTLLEKTIQELST